MQSSFQTSTGKLMLLVVVTAVELELFRDVWWILVLPFLTIVMLALNLGLWFLLLRPRWMETRIIGALLASVAAAAGTALYMYVATKDVLSGVGYQRVGPVGAWLLLSADAWEKSLPQQAANLASLLRTVSTGATLIEFVFLDLCGFAVIWAGGILEHRLRQRRRVPAANGSSRSPTIDGCATAPL